MLELLAYSPRTSNILLNEHSQIPRAAAIIPGTFSGEGAASKATNLGNNSRAILPCVTTEAFCSLFAETALEAESVPEYIDKAVAFANQYIWGSLNATIIVHPDLLKDAEVRIFLSTFIKSFLQINDMFLESQISCL